MSFWENLGKIFNLFPRQKSYDELTGELDNKMQDFYTKMGWGKYNSPCSSHNVSCDLTRSISSEEWNNLAKNNKTVEEVYGDIRMVTSSQFLDEMLKLVPKNKFVPYSYYNKDMDSIQVYWSNDESYTQPVANGSINLKIAFDTNEVIGVDILNANQLLIENRQPLTLDEQQRYAVYWLYDRYIGRSDKEPLIVNGINITEVIKGLTGRLF